MEGKENRLPLGLCKQAVMKMDSFLSDIHEIILDEDISPEEKETFTTIKEMGQQIISHIVSIVSTEMDEDDFMNEDVQMDEIDKYPETEDLVDIIDTPIE